MFSIYSIMICIGLMVVAGSCVTDKDPDSNAGDALAPGFNLPDFSVKLTTGETVTTSSLEGRVPVIILFNTSCPDCREELPVVQQVSDYFRDNDEVAFLAIARAEGEESIMKFWTENKLTIPVSPQPDSSIYNLFAYSIIPRIYIADKSGIITASYADFPLPSYETLITDILDAL